MGTSLSGVDKFSIYDPDTGTTVEVEDKYIAAENTSVFERSMGSDLTGTRGQAPATSDRSEIELEITETSGISQLETWDVNDTPVQAVFTGPERSILWETDTLLDLQAMEGVAEVTGLNQYMLNLRHELGRPPIYVQNNLLARLGTDTDAWVDDDSDQIADGYEVQGVSNEIFFSDTQSFDTASDGNDDVFKATDLLRFPLEGVTLTLSATHPGVHSTATSAIELIAYDQAGNTLQTDTTTFTSSGDHSVTMETPASTFEIEIRPLVVQSVGSSESVSIEFPALRVDGGTTFTNY